jgi:hypothetical protein
MKQLAAAAAIALLTACGGRDPSVQTVTIYEPSDTHFVRTISYDERTSRVDVSTLGVSQIYAVRRGSFPAPPLDALRWIKEHGGFDQPIQTTQASGIVGVRVALSDGSHLETRFASAWDVDEPSELKRVQSWYQNAVYHADTASNAWRNALAYAIHKGRVRQIRFSPGNYILVIDRNGQAHIAIPHGRRVDYAHGRIDQRALGPVYQAALHLSPHLPALPDTRRTRVDIITQGRRFTAIGSNGVALQVFSSRMDQLAHDIRWSRRISWNNAGPHYTLASRTVVRHRRRKRR